MIEVLLVGGHSDGQRVTVAENLTQIWMPIESNPSSTSHSSQESKPWKEVYLRQNWRAERAEIVIFAIDGMTAPEVLNRLIANYAGETHVRKH